MWLINTHDYTLREVYEARETYPYAILSHTWDESEDDPLHREVTFQEMRELTYARKKTGWIKIQRTCDLAKAHGLRWAWIDTCCIDKSNSVELAESINSMFRWYQDARVCFVHLSDMPSFKRKRKGRGKASSLEKHSFYTEHLPRCRWFTRGWTLQELVAPAQIHFHDNTWREIGTKESYAESINLITGIDLEVLSGNQELSDIPVCRRMYWASSRQTKRIEDVAYSLLGIFDINMPLIYGEGKRAFLRLQEAIAQNLNDLTLFAWHIEKEDNCETLAAQKYYGMFADSPRNFKQSANFKRLDDPSLMQSQSFTLSNRGVQFLINITADRIRGDYIVTLCAANTCNITEYDRYPRLLAIRIVRTMDGFIRHEADRMQFSALSLQYLTNLVPIKIPKHVDRSSSHRLHRSRRDNIFRFRVDSKDFYIYFNDELMIPQQSKIRDFETIYCPHAWDSATYTFMTGGHGMFAGLLWPVICHRRNDMRFSLDLRIVCGFDRVPREDDYDMVPSNPLVPWAYIISRSGSGIESDSRESGDIAMNVLDNITRATAPRRVVGELARHITRIVYRGSKYATAVTLRSQPRGNVPSTPVSMSLHVTTVQEDECTIHDVVIKVEMPDGGVSLPEPTKSV